MKKISALDRLLLLLTGLLAAYQIIYGVEGGNALAIVSYTLAFGVLLVAGLIIIILGFDVLDSPLVVIASTLIPLGISQGLVADNLPGLTLIYLIFAVVGFGTIIITRYAYPGRPAIITLAFVHGISGLLIFILPLYLSLMGLRPPGYSFIALGGALMGMAGLLLSFLKTGRPLLSRDKILTILPGLLLLTTAAFVKGFASYIPIIL